VGVAFGSPCGAWFAWRLPVSAGGALLLTSLTLVVEEVGVPTFELLGERESAPTRVVDCDDGDAVPDVESFFLDDLSLSLVLDNWSC
jgi:hypothetical protein